MTIITKFLLKRNTFRIEDLYLNFNFFQKIPILSNKILFPALGALGTNNALGFSDYAFKQTASITIKIVTPIEIEDNKTHHECHLKTPVGN